jgi:tripartite motif-containing protein 71
MDVICYMKRDMIQNPSRLLVLLLAIAGLTTITFIVVLSPVVLGAKGQAQEFNVYKFDSEGNFILGWGSRGSGPGQFYHAHGIAIDSSGDVYVSDQGNFQSKISHPDAIPHISKFTADGKFITKWGSEGSGPGQFTRIEDMATDSSGNLYVAELGNSRISKFTADGKFITAWGSEDTASEGSLSKPWGVAVDSSGNILVTDKGRNMAFKFTSDGKYLQTLVPTGPADGQLQHPHGIAIDSSGNFYIPDQVHGNVQKFSPDGKFLLKIGSEGSGEGQFHHPHGIAIDSSDNIYVADTGNNRFEKFTADGQFIKSWGPFGDPHDIKIDASGNLYLINTTYDDVSGASQAGGASQAD